MSEKAMINEIQKVKEGRVRGFKGSFSLPTGQS